MAGILRLENVSKSFGALKVIDGITLSVIEGETLGILGPNGAGKTTLFNLISGDLHADSGRVLFGGEDVTSQLPHRRCRSGIGQAAWPSSRNASHHLIISRSIRSVRSVPSNRSHQHPHPHPDPVSLPLTRA